jgi:hypothetical protein
VCAALALRKSPQYAVLVQHSSDGACSMLKQCMHHVVAVLMALRVAAHCHPRSWVLLLCHTGLAGHLQVPGVCSFGSWSQMICVPSRQFNHGAS